MNARRAVVLIALAEFFGTSLWFTANGVAPALAENWGIDVVSLGYLTSAVQLGFISGTLLLALSGLADRYAATRIFFVASIIGALANLGFAVPGNTFALGLLWRFITGLALAGIYPLGMKLVVSWAPERAGRALGWLVGMLVLGTSLPHLLEAASFSASWQWTLQAASVLAIAGGGIVLAVGDGPNRPPAGRFNPGGVLRAFRNPDFRAAAGGYFGHMWEIYALWTVAPYLVAQALPEDIAARWISLGAFVFIAVGALGCVAGGMFSHRIGSARVGFIALLVSGLSCVMYPLLASTFALPTPLVIALLLVWGASAAGDSPQFSALIARHAPADAVGSSLAIVNGIGFLITVAAISALTPLWKGNGVHALWLLVPGPAIGLVLLMPLLRSKRKRA